MVHAPCQPSYLCIIEHWAVDRSWIDERIRKLGLVRKPSNELVNHLLAQQLGSAVWVGRNGSGQVGIRLSENMACLVNNRDTRKYAMRRC